MTAEPTSRRSWHRFATTAATQVSFSGSSILATLAVSALSENPKADLAFLGGVLLMQGLVRVIVGLNLGIVATSRGALYPALAMAALGGVAYVGIGYEQWCAALLLAVPFESARTVLTRSPSTRAHAVVVIADALWLVPVVAILVIGPADIGATLATGAGFGLLVCLSERAARAVMRESLAPSRDWLVATRHFIARSSAEASTGIAIPFVVVAVLTAMSEFDDVNALRASAQAVSPIGSAVALFVLRWPELDGRRRRRWSHVLVGAPLALPLLAAVVPEVFASLSADSPNVMPFAFGWAAFGCVQSRMALANADKRAGLDTRLPSAPAVAMAATAYAVAGLLTADRTSTALSLAIVVAAPIGLSLWVRRSSGPPSTELTPPGEAERAAREASRRDHR